MQDFTSEAVFRAFYELINVPQVMLAMLHRGVGLERGLLRREDLSAWVGRDNMRDSSQEQCPRLILKSERQEQRATRERINPSSEAQYYQSKRLYSFKPL